MVSFEENPVKHLLTVHYGHLVPDDLDGLDHAHLVRVHDREHSGCIVFPDEVPEPPVKLTAQHLHDLTAECIGLT